MRRLFVIIATIGGFALAGWAWQTRVYPWRLTRIQQGFASIPGARIVASGGYSDITLEEVWVEVAIKSGGTLRLRDFGSDSFEVGGIFALQRAGPWMPALTRYDGDLYFGPRGEARALLPQTLNSISAIVEHYDTLVQTIERWPTCPAQADGRDDVGAFQYCKRGR